ncbi:MAG: type II secretion system protein N [Gammaproteobacteria bacterium]
MKLSIILTMLGAYLLFLVTQLPAGLVFSLTKDYLGDVEIAQPEGTFWKGSSSQVRYADIDLGRLLWDARPLNLLLGEWSNRVSVDGTIPGQANIGLSFGPRVSLSDAVFSFDLADLEQIKPGLAAMGINLGGELSATLDELVMTHGKLQRVDGVLTLQGLVIPRDQNLGDFTGELVTDDEGTMRFTFRSVGDAGPGVQGLLTMTPDARIALDLFVTNPDAFGKTFSSIYKSVSASEQGGYRFEWQGELGDLSKYL